MAPTFFQCATLYRICELDNPTCALARCFNFKFLAFLSTKMHAAIGELGWKDGLGIRTLTTKLSSLGSNPDPARNCHPGVSQEGWFINVRVIPRMDVKRASPLSALVSGRYTRQVVLREEKASYRRHHGQITNSCPNLRRALHQRLSRWCYPASLCCIRTKMWAWQWYEA